ncbi:MAG TPA: hypothetical protein VGQ75_01235 [Thermoanaerobaculia bacterium]|nr:hypothetical protein [Thermoanaerobaculia bacterium]HEV8608600.1 hypothetical protein [Thermoanaerobaculia bacterium]
MSLSSGSRLGPYEIEASASASPVALADVEESTTGVIPVDYNSY